MKFFAPIVVAVVTLFSVQVDANGVCYDPNHGSEMSASSVQADMQTISGAGFSSVRTYISKFGNTEMGPIITGAGLTAVLGVPYPQSDYQEQMAAAIKAAQAGGVYAIMVGNENLAGASSVPGDMISVIQQIKSQVPSGVLVGTVQRNTEVINYQSVSGWSELVSACDVLGVNAHPFFNPGTTADGAIDVLDKQWQTMMSSFGDKLLLTETGWPSSGSVAGNTGSLAGEQTFYSAYQKWSAGLSEKFYFQFFDVPSRAEAYEQTFGLYTSNSQPKFGMAQSPSTSSNHHQQQQQQAPTTSAPTTQAPAPTTPAPAPEPATEKPQPTTAAPTPAPETKQSSGSGETNSNSNYNNNSTSSISSTSGSHEQQQQQQQNGSASLSSSDKEAGVSSKNTEEKDSKTDGSKSDKPSDKTSQTTETTAQTAESTVSSIGKSSETQQTSSTSDDTQKANTQSSEGSGASGMVGLAVGGGVCAVLVAFGFIYQIRKRAQELEEDKEQSFSAMTPVENICSL
ncbi:hypothetical protein PHYSODRAFT_558708 [Phytophthora sojae]|uniref:glucan endo-1,3-beta-D-glucosidase n=1 Tax=Phytophthora sojae (strain P6497) TaxID=1094619 RepID=G4Z596_PHYSP|nr:hypothetical protein PHYSODRAFT_558708 [Phytophthora sojae]EGZ20239.1 hypothetical protein PHYSODRAFT_558708 [Phytophthora sojae]|eukprot:XP_009522956.1 hypothetical protein PHYSODRAFT_558708 [Phytophthora sojae]